MSASHTLTPSRSHARPTLAARLVSRFRGHDDLPEAPAADLQDHGDGMTEVGNPPGSGYFSGIGDATTWHPGQYPPAPADEPWWGLTELDNPPVHHRPYVQEPPPAGSRVLDIYDDLRDLPALRDAIRATTQRAGTQCGTCGRLLPGGTWGERFAAQLAHLGSGEDAPSSKAASDALAGYAGRHSAGSEAAA